MSEEILKLIEEDEDIAILVLAAGTGKEGPGPLVAEPQQDRGQLSDPGGDRSRHLDDDEEACDAPVLKAASLDAQAPASSRLG